MRSVFIIGPDKKVKLTLTYPASTGRNFDEILRVIDSLQLTANYSVATPANWKNGQDVIIVPAVSDEDAKKKFPKGFKADQALPARHAPAEPLAPGWIPPSSRDRRSRSETPSASAQRLKCPQSRSGFALSTPRTSRHWRSETSPPLRYQASFWRTMSSALVTQSAAPVSGSRATRHRRRCFSSSKG